MNNKYKGKSLRRLKTWDITQTLQWLSTITPIKVSNGIIIIPTRTVTTMHSMAVTHYWAGFSKKLHFKCRYTFYRGHIWLNNKLRSHIVFYDHLREVYGTITHNKTGVLFSSGEPTGVKPTHCFFSREININTLEPVNNSTFLREDLQERFSLICDNRLTTEKVIKIAVERCVDYDFRLKRYGARNDFVSVKPQQFSPTTQELLSEAGFNLNLSKEEYTQKITEFHSIDYGNDFGHAFASAVTKSLQTPFNLLYTDE